jgi:hypothetical protein
MKNYEIESGIPVPPTRRRSRFGTIRFSEMQVGQSVLLDNSLLGSKKDSGEYRKKYRAVYSSIYKLLRSENPAGKYKVAAIQSRGRIEIRLWRVE